MMIKMINSFFFKMFFLNMKNINIDRNTRVLILISRGIKKLITRAKNVKKIKP